MGTNVPKAILDQLRLLESDLQRAVSKGSSQEALEIATKIQILFGEDRRHSRLLRAKLQAFEACLDTNQLVYAESGFSGIRQLASNQTRLYLEASALLAVCYLRLKQPEKAKPLIQEILERINNIRSDTRRHQFQERLIHRIEEECVLSDVIGRNEGELIPAEIHVKAVQLLQTSSEDEILKLIGNSLPSSTISLLRNVRGYSIAQLSPPDQKLLPSSKDVEIPKNIGKTVFAVIRRIGWKTLCDPESSIYKAWSKRVPEVYSDTYFATALATTFANWKIGIPMLVSGTVALVMKYSAQEFCNWAKPKGLMIGRGEKES